MLTGKRTRALVEFGSPVVLLLLWAFVSASHPSPYFPPLTMVLESFRDVWLFDGIASDVVPSVRRLALGYGAGCALGFAGGILLGLWPSGRRAVDPVIQFLRSIPPPALLPLAMLVLGIGDAMKIAVIGFVCLWPVLISTVDGVRSVDALQRDTAAAFNLAPRDILLHVVIPAAMPRVFAGLRVSLALAVILMVISEMVSSTDGIGFFVLQAQSNFAIPDMWSGILMLGLLGYLLNLILELIEKRSLRWYHAARRLDGD